MNNLSTPSLTALLDNMGSTYGVFFASIENGIIKVHGQSESVACAEANAVILFASFKPKDSLLDDTEIRIIKFIEAELSPKVEAIYRTDYDIEMQRVRFAVAITSSLGDKGVDALSSKADWIARRIIDQNFRPSMTSTIKRVLYLSPTTALKRI